MKELEYKYIAPYTAFNLKAAVYYMETNRPVIQDFDFRWIKNGIVSNIAKPLLRPVSQITQEIVHNGQKFTPIDFFEVGDENDEVFEYTNGNIKLIKELEEIAKYDIHHDIQFLPYGVVQKLIEWKFDIFDLHEDGLVDFIQ